MRDLIEQHNRLQSRRQFLKTSGMGLGVTALASLLPQNSAAQPALHHTPRAKRVIFLFMAGAPSQIDLFDYKPKLERQFKQPLPESISMGQRVTAMTKGKTQLVAPSRGAPSQIDLFDYKPKLERQFKQPLPESISMGQRVTAMTIARRSRTVR